MSTYYADDPQAVRLSVSAVVRRNTEGSELLLMRRSDNGLWGLPGGYVEPGESVSEATAREVYEETGYEIEIGRLVGVYSDPKRQVIAYPNGNRVQAVNLCFEGRVVGQGEPTTPEETLEVGFFPDSALPEDFVPIHSVRIEDATRSAREAAVR